MPEASYFLPYFFFFILLLWESLSQAHFDLPGLSSATPWDSLGLAPLRVEPGAGFLTWVPGGRSLSVSGHTFMFGGKQASVKFLRFT